METYKAVVEIDGAAVDIEALRARLAAFDPSLETSPRGYLSAQVSVEAESLFYATAMAIAAVRSATRGEPIGCQVMREGNVPVGPLAADHSSAFA